MIKRTIEYHAHYLSDGTIPALTGFGHSVLTLDVQREFPGDKRWSTTTCREHSDGGERRKIYCSLHPIMKMVIMIAPSLTPGALLLERS